jgi:hypothetical protein
MTIEAGMMLTVMVMPGTTPKQQEVQIFKQFNATQPTTATSLRSTHIPEMPAGTTTPGGTIFRPATRLAPPAASGYGEFASQENAKAESN